MTEVGIRFETTIGDIKTSRIKKDTCLISGMIEWHGREVAVTMTLSSDEETVFDDMFNGVGSTVTFEIVDNAQQTLQVE